MAIRRTVTSVTAGASATKAKLALSPSPPRMPMAAARMANQAITLPTIKASAAVGRIFRSQATVLTPRVLMDSR